MRDASTYRWHRKAVAKSLEEDIRPSGRDEKAGFGRLNKWLGRHPKLAPYYGIAVSLLKTGPRSQEPGWAAVRKMMVVLATAPLINMPGYGRVPYVLGLGRHKRGSWRSFPHQTVDANLQVTS